MALTSALFTGLSGLNVNTTQMNVVGNNIANANTTSFKTSRVLFTPQFYVTDQAGSPPSSDNGGANPSQRGLGASVSTIEQDFTPGSIQATGHNTDMAIDGSGFFVIKNAGKQQFTRDGAFSLDSNNQLVTGTGAFLQGYGADTTGSVVLGELKNITIPLGTSSISTPTSKVKMKGNLDASGAPAAGASILTSGDVTLLGGAAAPATTDLLTNISDVNSNATPLFNAGDKLTVGGIKGGRALPVQTFTVTAASTVQDMLDFYNQGLGIDTTATNPNVPTPGATLQADPANPTAMQFEIVGNEGSVNALELAGGGIINQNGVSPLTFADGIDTATSVASDPSGESVHTSFTAYDSLGNPVSVEVAATLESTGNTGNVWRFMASSDDNKSGGPVLGNGTLTFDSQGNLKSSTGTVLNIDRTGTGAQSPMSFTLNFDSMTQLSGQTSSLVMSNQDGMPPGSLSSFSVGLDGIITGAYSNGMTRALGQIALASFANPNGLDNVGGNIYAQGANSGSAVISTPLELGTGSIRSGSLELSNVDLSQEFTNLIIASTGFSASSRVISTSDQLIQELLNSSR